MVVFKGNLHSKKGLTLIEFMVSILISGIFMMMFTGAIVHIIKSKTEIDTDIDKHASRRVSSDAFLNFAEKAGLSMQYFHLPIDRFCNGNNVNSICIRKFNTGTAHFDSLSSTDNIFRSNQMAGVETQTIEFYRDDYTNIVSQTVSIDENVPLVFKTQPITLNTSVATSEYYATWPLVNGSSAPLPIIAYSSDSPSLTFRNLAAEIASNNPAFCNTTGTGLNTTFGNNLFFQSNSDPSAVLGLANRLLVVYNFSDPTQYIIQKVSSVTSCAQNQDLCMNKFMSDCQTGRGPDVACNTSGDLNWFRGGNSDWNGFYIITMSPYEAIQDIPNSITYTSTFTVDSQTSKAFPTKSFNYIFQNPINYPSAIGWFSDSAASGNIAIHKVHTAKYCTENAIANFNAIVVDARKIKIASSTDPNDSNCPAVGKKCALWSIPWEIVDSSLNIASPMNPYRLIDNLESKILITRQIGTNSLSLYMKGDLIPIGADTTNASYTW